VGRIAPAGGALQQLRIMGENGSVDSQAEGERPFINVPLQTDGSFCGRKSTKALKHKINQYGMAVEAVIGEPVSVSEFPVSRENTGKFAA